MASRGAGVRFSLAPLDFSCRSLASLRVGVFYLLILIHQDELPGSIRQRIHAKLQKYGSLLSVTTLAGNAPTRMTSVWPSRIRLRRFTQEIKPPTRKSVASSSNLVAQKIEAPGPEALPLLSVGISNCPVM